MPSSHSLGRHRSDVVTLPSLSDPDNPESPHNTCRVRRLDPTLLMEAGILDSLNLLTAFVQQNHINPNLPGGKQSGALEQMARIGDKEPAEMMKFIKENAETVAMSMLLMDKVCCMALVEPRMFRRVKVLPDGSERAMTEKEVAQHEADNPGSFFSDEVDMADKVKIFDHAMAGVRTAEPFRSGPTKNLVHLEAFEGIRLPAERTSTD